MMCHLNVTRDNNLVEIVFLLFLEAPLSRLNWTHIYEDADGSDIRQLMIMIQRIS
jgi:hypothetical protein